MEASQVKKAKETIGEAIEYLKAKKLISNNSIEFEYNNEVYRIVLPTLEQEIEVENAKNKKLNELLMERDEKGNSVYMFKEQWKEIYKQRGINLDDYESRLQILTIDVENLLEKLAQTQDRPEIIKIEKKIADLRNKIAEISAFIIEKYKYSIEHTLLFFSQTYLLSLVLEKKKGKKWARVFRSFKEMEKYPDSGLIKVALTYLGYLMNLENSL